MLGDGGDRLALGVAVVRDQREGEALAALLEDAVGARSPALRREQRAGGLRVVGQRRHRAVVPLGGDGEGAAHALALAVEDVPDDLVGVDRHAEGAPHLGVREQLVARVVAEVAVAELHRGE